MASVFKALKAEPVDDAGYATRSGSRPGSSRRDVFAVMADWHDRQRLRSAIGSITPKRMEPTAA